MGGWGRAGGEWGDRRKCFGLPLDCYPSFSNWVAWNLVEGERELMGGWGRAGGEWGDGRKCFGLPLDCYPYFSKWVAGGWN